jgi:hypothetical protein
MRRGVSGVPKNDEQDFITLFLKLSRQYVGSRKWVWRVSYLELGLTAEHTDL